MPQLFTLGELRLEADDGTVLSRRGKPLLLLAYLARRAPHAVARAELASLLWGERAEARARHSLRQALLELHRLVGERLRVTPESAALDTTSLLVDAVQFERDVESGRDHDAIGRWHGDFLAEADDRAELSLRLWLETERAGLRRRLTLAFDRLLDDAERREDARTASTIARRWTEIAPLDEHACARLIAILRRAGNPVEALSAHTRFAAHLKEALDVEPSRDFLRLGVPLYAEARDNALPDAPSPSTERRATPLVGRESALASLKEAWRAATSGKPTVAVLVAEHGMGATRLCEELARVASGTGDTALVLHCDGRTDAAAPSASYESVRVLLGPLAVAPALGGVAPETLAALAEIVPALRSRFSNLPATASVDAMTLALAARDALEAASEDAPVLLLSDALPDADVESRALLLALAERVRGAVMLVLVLGPEAAGEEALARLREVDPRLRVVVLAPLSSEHIAEIVHALAPMLPHDRSTLAQRLFVETAGIPLYVTAAVEALLEEQLLSPDESKNAALSARLGGRDFPVPARVRSDVRRRMQALDADAQRVLEAVAVLGVPFTRADVCHVANMPATAVDGGLTSLHDARFLGQSDAGRWPVLAPPVVVHAVYALVPPLRREALHASAATLGARASWPRDKVDRRASYHLERAGGAPIRRTRRWRSLLAAGFGIASVAAVGFMWFGNGPTVPRDRTTAIFPFAVRGGSNVEYLQSGMVDLLSTSLDGVGGVRTLDPRAVIAATNAAHVATPLDPEHARAIAMRLGATYYVLGTVVDAAGQLKMSAAVYDVRGNRELGSHVSAVGAERELFTIIDRVTAQLAVAQGARPGERFAEIAAVTTSSLEALKAYLEGRRAYRANDLFAALPAFQHAVTADSSFALAWYGLATTASWMLQPAQEQYAAKQAVRESARLSPRDRMLVEAFAAYSRGSADSAERMATSIVETYDDIEGWVLLGEVLYHHNWKRGRSISESRQAWKRVLALDPSYWPALQHLSEVAALEGKAAEADSLLGGYEASVGAPHMMLASRALRAYTFGDQSARAALAPQLSADRGFFLILSVWYVSVFGRDVDHAKALAGMLIAPLRPPEQQGFGRILLAHLDLAQGKWREARAQLAIARVLTPHDAAEYQLLLSMAPFLATSPTELNRQRGELLLLSPAPATPSTLPWSRTHGALHPMLRAYLAGVSSARTGDDGRRAQALAELGRLTDPTASTALARGFAFSIGAEWQRKQGRRADALAELERGARQTPFVPAWTSGFVSQAYERYLRAELLHELGRDDEALRWYGVFGDNSPYDLVYLAPSLYRQAQIYDARGDKALAVQRYARFAELWKNCDPELQPLVGNARQRIALLQ
jgi:DNA-binding SARP family transcriptional activator/tetratricopeptide (TPR) repeat protein